MKGLLNKCSAALIAAALGGCVAGRVTIVDGDRGIENFNRLGEANWTVVDGAITADKGGGTPAYLVSKSSYGDFKMRVEFWASEDANSGVFVRCQDLGKISDENCYEVNIFDQRPDPTYATGAIVKVAPVGEPRPKAGGKWNVYEISMSGPNIKIVLNGKKTVDIQNAKFASGLIALQWVRGTIKFRKVEIRPL